MNKSLIFSLICMISCLNCDEKEFSKGITSCLLIKDYATAVNLGKTAIEAYPKSDQISSLVIRSLAENGESLEALKLFQREFSQRSLKDNFSLLETIAWATLIHSEEKSEMARVSSLIGASLTQDCRTVDLITDSLESSNVLLRSFALRLAPQYNDRSVQKKVLELLRTERNWHVRLELLQTVGFMKLTQANPFLKELIASPSVTQEEKIAAIHALVNIYEDVTDKDLDLLLSSKRSGLRELGIAIIDHFDKKDKIPLLVPLLKDPSPHVRALVLSVLGTMEIEEKILFRAEKDLDLLINDVHPQVAILAAWLKLRLDSDEGRESLVKWVLSNDLPSARFGAVVLGASGIKGSHLLAKLIDQVTDPYVKVNLALAMVKQKVDLKKAIEELKGFFLDIDGEIMWQPGIYPMFNQLVPSNVHHQIQIPRYPALMDHLTRLDLLNILCIAGCTEASDLVKKFLSKQMWGIVTGASVLLIEEGDSEAIHLIRKLLDDENEITKIQAALALAFYGGDPKAAKILETAYPKVDWERKIQILEALGFIGNRDSIPFLLEVMKEPFTLLRTIAASSVIQCLYH
jgi:HEAT repeat protein